MRHLLIALLTAFSLACAPATDGSDEDDEGAVDDTGSGGDDGGGSGPQPAPLATVSGSCPDLSTSTTTTFESSGEEREVTVVVPEDPNGTMGVVFFFHGLMDPGQTPHPAEYIADALDMQDVADAHNSVIVLPVSQTMSMAGISFFMWDANLEGDEDLVLFDDLRTCVAEQHDVDLKRLSTVGFSGGALWNTVMVVNRADTLSSAVEWSGGSDYTIPLFEGLWSEWSPPDVQVPVMLGAGGTTDVWPDASFPIVNFLEGTDRLELQLVDAGHTTVRCDHDQGHTITYSGWNAAIDWVTGHVYGEASPWADDLGDLGNICERGGE